jgi:hypothetical protein|tara:strand:+ start:401 stop:1222 length:822 start_codon:yes stop_codon:yes gene_type:complete
MSGLKKMTDVTFVSALFNIDRVDGRKWDEYLKWFDVTLQLQAPMTLFVTEDLVEFVQKRRDGTGKFATHIITSRVEDIPYYDLKDDIQEILDSEEYKKNMADPERIECKQAMYSVIQYSKFRWLLQSLAYNGKECDYFFWLDAGASRFFEGYDLSKEYPSEEAKKSLKDMGDSFLVQMNTEYYKDLVNAETLSLDYLYDNRSYVLGSMFGGHKESIVKVHDIVDNLLKNDMIANRNVNNEQIALGYLIKKYPDVFSLYERTNGKHMDLFQELG